jgi:hypothetical protein
VSMISRECTWHLKILNSDLIFLCGRRLVVENGVLCSFFFKHIMFHFTDDGSSTSHFAFFGSHFFSSSSIL